MVTFTTTNQAVIALGSEAEITGLISTSGLGTSNIFGITAPSLGSIYIAYYK